MESMQPGTASAMGDAGRAPCPARSKRRAIARWLSLALALSLAAHASDALPFSPGPLEMQGPLDSTVRLEVYNRFRGEFVDWFATNPGNSQPTSRYNFLANKFQLGLRVKRDPVEMFAQLQPTIDRFPSGRRTRIRA